MSTTPPEAPGSGRPALPPLPPGYRPGDYVPFKDRDPQYPTRFAGQWDDQPATSAQQGGTPMTHEERYRAIYGLDAPTRTTFASWGRRVLGYLVDSFFSAVAAIPLVVGYWMLLDDLEYATDAAGHQVISDSTEFSTASIALIVVGAVIALAFGFWNVVLRQGRTGYTLGKTVVGIRLVDAASGQPVGAALSLVRQFAHVVDSLVCYLGWLWPLWDPRCQTLADKIMGTVVVILPQDEAQL